MPKMVQKLFWSQAGTGDYFTVCIDEVKIAHPLKVKAIAEAKIKIAKISADILAYLLRVDLIPECYVRGKSSRRIQQVLRQKIFLVRFKIMVGNKIH